MGCASSQHYPLEIQPFDRDDDDDNNKFTTGNKSATVKDGKHHHHHNNNNDIATGSHMGKNVLRGDVNQKYQAERDRVEKLKDKQKKAAKAAENLSSQVMEERETLSLTSRSRGTSRATSRTASPTGTRKLYKPQMSEVNSEAGDQADNSSSNQQQPQNAEPIRTNS